ncbi:acetate--CoA ligase family protein [Roseomonas gilardii]|uniref:Acetate--CoA ligase family protein n=1 Tax=Roseomonas gilardii TaxID=257708 RepID=A0ABU3MLH2_9PROT|nr:acetate--CoA ligase family protein [Roseomonas gilardii]MDT8333861.1 acetate--CoA ligase family protein [Roseomonas gilardii]
MATERAVYRLPDLQKLIDPKSVAVVGASATLGSFGQRTLANLAGFHGKVFGVNPKYREIAGRECFPSLTDLPEAPDCVVLCVARTQVEESLGQAIRLGVGGAIVYASGFAETGLPERVAEQVAIVTLAQRSGIRVAGPNCVGIANMRSGAIMNFMPDCGQMVGGRSGPVAIVSQSGALGYAVLQSMTRGVGVSHYLAAGNSADVDICDFISALADDPEVRSIICLFEGVKSGKRFLDAARRATAAGKALITYKAGNGEASRKAALSHTGTMVGADSAYRAAFEDVGAVVVDDLEAVIERASFFARNGRPARGRGVGIMSTSGGAGVINADKAEKMGLLLPELSSVTRRALEAVVPDFGAVANPADLTAEVLKTSSTFAHCLDAFVTDPGFSSVVVPFVFAHEASTGHRAPVLTEVAARTDCAVAGVWMTDWLEGPGSALLDADPRVTLFRSAERCMETIRSWHDWHERRDTPLDNLSPRLSPLTAADTAREIIAVAGRSGRTLSEQDSKRILATYGIVVPREIVISSPAEAADAAAKVGFPVVVKIASADVPHKTEVHGIRLNLQSAEAVRQAAEEILKSVRQHKPDARLDGLSVQSMAPPGAELVLGLQRDAQFGPMIAVGLGGVLVEVLGDVSTALAPVSPTRARKLLASLRGYRLLTGFRNQPALDVDAAVEAICRFSEMASDLVDVMEEVDVNPLIVGREGVVAADALVVLV